MPLVTLIAAVARNRVIGRGNALPWRLPGDLRRFRTVTLGKPVLMGRRTFESIGRPLPGRTNVVLTRSAVPLPDGVLSFSDVDAAVAAAGRLSPEVMVIGGAEIYARTLPLAGRLVLTEVDAAPEGDALFPEIDPGAWREVSRESADDPAADHAYAFVILERRNTEE